jgi:hypothetical protein
VFEPATSQGRQAGSLSWFGRANPRLVHLVPPENRNPPVILAATTKLASADGKHEDPVDDV